MNLLGCLDSPTFGRYLLDGRDVSHLAPDDLARVRNRNIGFVFQNFNLLPRTAAIENVGLPLRYCGMPRSQRHARAREVLATVGLQDRGQHYPSQLSGGQQQRVAIARALANRPVLVLADEPTGALDTQTSADIMHLLQRLNRDGVTILLVTHEPDIAQFARRRLQFRDGRLIDAASRSEAARTSNPPQGEHR
jgi:putative ABC transport system ATP-binding protein